MANRAQPFNARALHQMGVPPLESGIDGRGIAIGFIDYGFDILHPCFRRSPAGRTQFRYLWDQNTGREFDANFIDRLIAASERAGTREAADAEYDPHANNFGRHGVWGGAHATIMASIAAGSAVAGFRGVAPAADLIGVQLGLLDHHWKEEDAFGVPTWASWQPDVEPVWTGWRSYDDSPQIVSALDYVFERARHLKARGLVINLSIGAYSGAHDGRSAVEHKIAELAARGAQGGDLPCAVVVSAGNAGTEEGHFSGEAEPDRPISFAWRMNREDVTQNKLEIWYRSEKPLEVVLSPGAGIAEALNISPGRTRAIELCGVRVGIADHVPDARAPLSRVRILLHPPFVPDHVWPATGELSFDICCATDGSGRTRIHAWIERDDGLGNRSTLNPSDPASTLSGLAAAEGAIVVAGYDHHRASEHPDVFPQSSLGPLPWGGRGTAPLVCAPGHRIWGARSKTAGFIETSGTSAAAAFTSGVMALLMQRLARSRSLDPIGIADLLIAPDRRRAWSPRFGLGAINVAHVLGEVTA